MLCRVRASLLAHARLCGAAPFSTTPGSREDWERFRQDGKKVVDFIADYYRDLPSLPVKSEVAPGYLKPLLPACAPEEGQSLDDIMTDVKNIIVPGVTHWQHPKFFGFFPANSSPPGLMGDMLSSAFACVSFSWVSSPAATELETVTLDWFGKLLNLPPAFLSESGTGGGVIQGTASEAVVVALLAAKQRCLSFHKASAGFDPDTFHNKVVVYASDQAHSSVKKACMITGIPMSRFRVIPTTAEGGFRLSPQALSQAIQTDLDAGLVPLFCVGTMGTTSSCAFDPLQDIGAVCKQYGLWFHVDAAYAGPAMMCPEHSGLGAGLELAHSFDCNPHKWLLTNFDCSTMWVTHRKWMLDALSTTPEYLRSPEYDSGMVTDYRDWQLPLGRRFRSLKLWFVLKAYGARALRAYIRGHVALAGRFAALVAADDRFEMPAPPALSLVCFRLKAGNSENAKLMSRVVATGKTFMVNTMLGDKFTLRLAVGTPTTTAKDIDEVWALLQAEATLLLAQKA